MWESCGEFKAKGFDEAKAHLKKIADGICGCLTAAAPGASHPTTEE